MKCPKCKAENEDARENCKNCGTRLKGLNLSRTASFIPVEPSGLGKTGGYSRDTFVNVTAGTELWKKVGWKGAIIFVLCLIILVSILFIICKVVF
jgi:hypothetical protein